MPPKISKTAAKTAEVIAKKAIKKRILDRLVEILQDPVAFNNIHGIAKSADGKPLPVGPMVTKVEAHFIHGKQLKDMEREFCPEVDAMHDATGIKKKLTKDFSNLLTRITNKYKAAKQISESTGFGLTVKEQLSGMTIDDKLELMCTNFAQLDEIFGTRLNIDPSSVLMESAEPSDFPAIDLDESKLLVEETEFEIKKKKRRLPEDTTSTDVVSSSTAITVKLEKETAAEGIEVQGAKPKPTSLKDQLNSTAAAMLSKNPKHKPTTADRVAEAMAKSSADDLALRREAIIMRSAEKKSRQEFEESRFQFERESALRAATQSQIMQHNKQRHEFYLDLVKSGLPLVSVKEQMAAYDEAFPLPKPTL